MIFRTGQRFLRNDNGNFTELEITDPGNPTCKVIRSDSPYWTPGKITIGFSNLTSVDFIMKTLYEFKTYPGALVVYYYLEGQDAPSEI